MSNEKPRFNECVLFLTKAMIWSSSQTATPKANVTKRAASRMFKIMSFTTILKLSESSELFSPQVRKHVYLRANGRKAG